MTLFLLPPSETKNDPTGKARFNLKNLSFPQLTKARNLAIESLVTLSESSPTKARNILGLSAKQDFERLRNVHLKTSAVAPAWQVYNGVLFDAINAEALSLAAIKKLTKHCLVQSALFGLISLGDLIPAYRLSANSKLPKIGTLSNVWAKPCSEFFQSTNELIVDLRSSQYVTLAPIPKNLTDRVVVLKILQKMPSGPPKVVSHHNKATKGRIIREVVTGQKIPQSVDQLAKVISKVKADVQIVKPKKLGQPMAINVLISSL